MRTRRNRRGPRVNSRVPVTIEWSMNGAASRAASNLLRYETGFTRVVNTYGCLLVSPSEMDMQQRVRVTNLSTRNVADGVVVWKGTQRSDGWDVGVELVSPTMDFWGVEF